MTRRIDAVQHVREHPEMYLDGVLPRAEELARGLLKRLAKGGRQGVSSSVTEEGWWVVSAVFDWVQELDLSVEELFNNIVPDPDEGRNCMRPEIKLTAFSERLVSCGAGERAVLKGDVKDDDDVWDAVCGLGKGRAIAFHL